MTTATRNEAAERLRGVMRIFAPEDIRLFDEALAAERRATVERTERLLLLDVRAFIAGPDGNRDPYRADLLTSFDEWLENRRVLHAILDEEAAR